MSAPVVSVIIPAYNAERWLHDAVTSVLEQTFPDWELIIVNDGSTDDTLRIAHGYEDERIHVIDQANAGVSAARNAGIAASRGSFLCFMDADDRMLPHNLEAKLGVLKKFDVDWVFSDLALCDEHLSPTGYVLEGTDDDVLRIVLLNASTAVPTSCSNVVAKRRCFDEGIRFDEHLSNAADQDFTIQLAVSFSYRHIRGVFNHYRMVPGSMSKNIVLYQRDQLRLFRNAREQGLLRDRRFRRQCMANVYWAIGGSWSLLANKNLKALPFFIRAFINWPRVIVRPIRKRIWVPPLMLPAQEAYTGIPTRLLKDNPYDREP